MKKKINSKKLQELAQWNPAFGGEDAEEAKASISISPTAYTRNHAFRRTSSITGLQNIDSLPVPITKTGDYLDIESCVRLCRKAYYNFSLLRNTVDTIVEISNSRIYLKGKNKAANQFIATWLKKIGIWGLCDQFMREYYRSGNVFLYRIDGQIREEDKSRLTNIFGSSPNSIPVRYMILNPEDIRVSDTISFCDTLYMKMLSANEAARLKKPLTQADKDLAKELGSEVIQQIKRGGIPSIPLDKKKLYAVFYKKQDYEPFGVPFAWPVLPDIDWKLELKKIDRAIARTTDWAILLVTMGAKPEEGGMNPKAMAAMQEMMKTESIKRILVSDWTTKATWVIPDVAALLGPEKYKVVNQDIREGLNLILLGDEKFANSIVKTQIFLEKIREGREAFLNYFLIPEIERICEAMNFRSYPEPFFEEIDIKDELQYAKIYTRLMELGILDADSGIRAIETGELPMPEENLESQDAYKKLRDKGYFQPLIGGAKADAGATGRPAGSKSPQSSKNVKPIGTGKRFAGAKASFVNPEKFQENLALATSVLGEMETGLIKKHGLKKLNKEQAAVADTLVRHIIASASPSDWEKKVKEYINKPELAQASIPAQVDEISGDLGVGGFMAALMYQSRN